jgi:hypothetical protein
MIIELSVRFEVIRHNPERRVAVNEISLFVNEQRTIGVAVESDAEIAFPLKLLPAKIPNEASRNLD